jgi:predicted transcriptional regulator
MASAVTIEQVRADLFKAIEAQLEPPTVQPGDVTLEMVMEKWGCDRQKAARTMGDLVKRGLFEKLDGKLPSGRPGCIYRPK